MVIVHGDLPAAVSVNASPVGNRCSVCTLSGLVAIISLIVEDEVLLPSLASCELDGSHDGIVSELCVTSYIQNH